MVGISSMFGELSRVDSILPLFQRQIRHKLRCMSAMFPLAVRAKRKQLQLQYFKSTGATRGRDINVPRTIDYNA